MRSILLNSVKKEVKNWWISLLIGILALIVGIWCIVTPDTSLIALTYVFVFTLLISGIIEIIFAVSNRDILYDWGWSLAGGILDVIFGALLLLLPLPIKTIILIYCVGFWIMFRSIWMIGASIELRRMYVKDWGWFLAMAILGLIFSFIFIISPVFSGIFIVAFASVALLLYGVFRIYMAFKLRSIHKLIKEMESETQLP